MSTAWADLIKLHRSQFGLTQAELSALLGVSQRTVSRWERGEDRPSFGMQSKLRDLRYRSSPTLSQSLKTSVVHAPVPRALSSLPGLRLHALSRPAIAKRPSIVNWIGEELAPIARGVLQEMLDDRELQRAIQHREIAAVVSTTRSVLETPEATSIGSYRTTISYLEIDGELYSDAVSAPADDQEPLGYRAIPFDHLPAS